MFWTDTHRDLCAQIDAFLNVFLSVVFLCSKVTQTFVSAQENTRLHKIIANHTTFVCSMHIENAFATNNARTKMNNRKIYNTIYIIHVSKVVCGPFWIATLKPQSDNHHFKPTSGTTYSYIIHCIVSNLLRKKQCNDSDLGKVSFAKGHIDHTITPQKWLHIFISLETSFSHQRVWWFWKRATTQTAHTPQNFLPRRRRVAKLTQKQNTHTQ